MKRTFTSFLLAATCFAGASAQTHSNVLFPKVSEGTEPTYAIPEGQKNKREALDGTTRYRDRLVYSLGLGGTTVNGELKPFFSKIHNTYDSQKEVFVDRTNETVELSAGDNVTIDLKHNVLWMHSYLYIDYDHDGVFNETNELVAYSFYSESNSSSGVNSKGDRVEHNVLPDKIPGFTVDSNAKSVKTRMRLKIDWNSKNPVGNPAPDNSIGANAGTIIDFSVNIHGQEVVAPKHAITLGETVHGTFQVLQADGTEVKSGDEIAEGTELTVKAAPADGYRVKEILVNDQALPEGETKFTVEGATKVNVSFEEDVQMWTINVKATEGGTVQVIDGDGNSLSDGSQVKHGTVLAGVKIRPNQGYTLTSLLVDGRERVDEVVGSPFMGMILEMNIPVTGNVDVQATFTPDGQVVTKHLLTLKETAHGFYKVKDEAGNELFDGDKVAEGTSLTIETTPDEGYKVKEIRVNGNVLQEGEKAVVNGETTIEVTFEAIAQMWAVTYETAIGGTFKVLNAEGQEISNGQKVAEGSKLRVEATASEDYVLKEILVNGSPVENGAEFTVNGATDIKVAFETKADSWTVTIKSTKGGSVVVKDANGAEIKNGDKVKDGTMLEGIMIREDKGCTLTSLSVNGTEMVDQVFFAPGNMIILMYSEPITSNLDINVVFDIPTGISEVTLAEAGYDAASQSLNIPAGAYAAVYNAAGQLVMNAHGGQQISTSALANGVYVARVACEGGVKVIKFMKK